MMPFFLLCVEIHLYFIYLFNFYFIFELTHRLEFVHSIHNFLASQEREDKARELVTNGEEQRESACSCDCDLPVARCMIM